MCYLAERGRSALKGVDINRTEPPKLEIAGVCALGAGLTPENTPLPSCYPVEFGRSRSNSASVKKEIPLKKSAPRVSPFKVTQGHRN